MTSTPAPAPSELADLVAAVVVACPAVVALHPGTVLRPVATYLPGRRVDGVRVDHRTVLVSVAARAGVSAGELAAQVRRAVISLAQNRTVDVHIADVQLSAGAPTAAVEAPGPPLVRA